MRLTEDFINTAAAGTAQGLNLKHVLLQPRSPCAPCTSGYRPPLPDLSSLRGLSKGEGSLKADCPPGPRSFLGAPRGGFGSKERRIKECPLMDGA